MQYESVFADIRALKLNDNTLNDLKFRCEWIMWIYHWCSFTHSLQITECDLLIGFSLVKYYLFRKMNIRIIINYQLKYLLKWFRFSSVTFAIKKDAFEYHQKLTFSWSATRRLTGVSFFLLFNPTIFFSSKFRYQIECTQGNIVIKKAEGD